ncbi:MAG: hypothetical protein E6G97_18300 [Alphaproteobacteria bacterium]|nr:MAG: hypothetical protein E6G97_18300 [Alphaproteobacteria bacterium]
MQEETKFKDLKDWLTKTALLPRREQHIEAIKLAMLWDMALGTAMRAQGKSEAEVLAMRQSSLDWAREFFRRELGLEHVG